MNRIASLIALTTSTTLVFAGPLNPPAGPVAPTHKTLTEVEPRTALSQANTPGDANSFYRITQPGSYYLTSNISVGTIEHGIQIDLNTEGLVTIDLNGFTVSGAEGTLNGIDVDPPFKPRVVLRNGSVTSFGGNGVDLTGAESATIENVESTRNSGKGFVIDTGTIDDCKAQFNSGGGFIAGELSTLQNCQALTTGPSGIVTGPHSTLVDCVAKNSTGIGIYCGSYSTLTRCVANDNASSGISTSTYCTLLECSASFNGEAGIGTNVGSTVIGCTAASNTKWGFSGGSSNTYQSCSAGSNGFQGFLASSSRFSDCVANSNKADGFGLGGIGNISNCTAVYNEGNGIGGGGACIVVNCVSSFNYKHGISLTIDGDIIRGNNCFGNGQGSSPGAGIHVEGLSHSIEDNICRNNDIGIEVIGTRSNIVRNSCAGNTTTNWSIAANNSYGPIIDRSAAATPAVNGNAAAGNQIGGTDPNANFTN